jgi:DNA-binding transcriptional ArsR family regulator
MPKRRVGAADGRGGGVSDAVELDESAVGAVFAALADPTRRHVVRLLAQRSTVTASALADDLPISRQAIAKHLAALADAGLVTAAHEGRETRYRLTPRPLGDAMHWMATAGARWDERLAKLAQRLADEA